VPKFLPADPVKRGRVKLALLLALFALPLFAAWAAYVSGWMAGNAANYGTLLPAAAARGSGARRPARQVGAGLARAAGVRRTLRAKALLHAASASRAGPADEPGRAALDRDRSGRPLRRCSLQSKARTSRAATKSSLGHFPPSAPRPSTFTSSIRSAT
jgi:hypothetical protein